MTKIVNRDITVDIAKGICILLVVCIHSEVFAFVPMPFTFIAVPMFFFMSGFFDNTNTSFQQFSIKNLRSLVLPAAIWTIIGVCYLYLLTILKGGQISYNFDVMNPCSGNGPCWFIIALAWVKLYSWIINRFKFNEYLVLLASLILGYVGINHQMPLYIDESCAAMPLYFLGKKLYLYREQIHNLSGG